MAAPSRSLSLDGIRGIALAAPVVVHLGLAGAGNGLWMAIGMFFTLSGFLITSLALKEIQQTGHLSATGFYARRIRRLMPAALLVLLLVVVAALLVDWPLVGALRNDVLAALLWFANWQQLGRGGYWANFFPSLTTHFWSLSLEEQVYLVFPVVLLLALRLRRGRWSAATAIGVLMGLLTAISWTIVWLSHDPARMYLSTWTRMGEATFGCMAAAISFARPVRVADERRTRRRAGVAIVLMMLAAAPMWAFADGDTVNGLRIGITFGTPLSAGVVAMLWRHPTSLPARCFSMRVPAWLGRRSYGIYLIHLPLIDLLAYRLHTKQLSWPWMLAAVAATVVLAGLLFRFVEEPLRVGRWFRTPAGFGRLIGGAVAALVTFTVITTTAAPSSFAIPDDVGPAPTTPGGGTVPVPTLPPTSPPTTSPGTTTPGDTTGTTTPPPAVTSPAPPTGPGRVLVIGDSTAWVTRGAVEDALAPDGWTTEEVHMVGCPIGGDARVKASLNGGAVYVREKGQEPGCDLWWDQLLPQWLAAEQPDLVVVVGGYGLAMEVDPAGDDHWCRLGDGGTACHDWAEARLAALAERVHFFAPHAHLVFTTGGHVDPYGPLELPRPAIDALNLLIRERAALDHASLLDLGAWLDRHLDLTVDGTHLGPDGVKALTPWMREELLAALAGERIAR